ncbi:hypothetical protein RHSIM_Rhsim11G0073000 [Rhododendron simsii]|uniref:Uncharacterized protein n=1 Tax=Rhododendron simsii TaxID=118357 RepID=A0A834G9C4_RHOSS|nr:hypothetical protein RHSIM_Rhsim11G0073000 [Rhododendron simsii]
MGLNPDEGAVRAGSEPRFKPKPNYVSLIPPKRKLVKKMMWDCMSDKEEADDVSHNSIWESNTRSLREETRDMHMKGVNPGEGAVQANLAKGHQPIRRFKPKVNGGSCLIPPQRKLVKKMMWDCIVHAISSCFQYPMSDHPSHFSGSSTALPISKHTCMKKGNQISPA